MVSSETARRILGRSAELFRRDLERAEPEVRDRVTGGSFLVLGGAGSIGQAVVKELFRRGPARLDVVDLSENNMVELVRDIRSSLGYIEGEFRALPLDIGGREFEAFLAEAGSYDHVLNLAALKHVRSEKDPYTLMRMLKVNVLDLDRTLRWAAGGGCRGYFCVSTDKSVAPANAMGATKHVMEQCLVRASDRVPITTARFANVAFSDGSLLCGFENRVAKRQPLAIPRGVRRYFMTAEEAGVLCLLACLAGGNREAFFPKLDGGLEALEFGVLAERYLGSVGYGVRECDSEEEARRRVAELEADKRWPCYVYDTDTTGEKELEEFHLPDEDVDLERFEQIGVIRLPPCRDGARLERALGELERLRRTGSWRREELLRWLGSLVPELDHKETHKFLDGRM